MERKKSRGKVKLLSLGGFLGIEERQRRGGTEKKWGRKVSIG